MRCLKRSIFTISAACFLFFSCTTTGRQDSVISPIIDSADYNTKDKADPVLSEKEQLELLTPAEVFLKTPEEWGTPDPIPMGIVEVADPLESDTPEPVTLELNPEPPVPASISLNDMNSETRIVYENPDVIEIEEETEPDSSPFLTGEIDTVSEQRSEALSEPEPEPEPQAEIAPELEIEPEPEVPEDAPLSAADIVTEHMELVLKLDRNRGNRVVLPGTGWIYLGAEGVSDELLNEPPEMSSRVLGAEETGFTFLFSSGGEYTLSFMNQNLSSGGFRQMEAVLRVESPSEEGVNEGTESSRDEEAAGEPTKAEPDILIMPLTLEEYERILEQAAEGMIPPLFASFWDDFLIGRGESGKEGDGTILAIAETLLAMKGGEAQTLAMKTLQYLAERAEPGTEDGIYIRLARLLESAGPVRDLKLSMEYYERVRDNYPAGLYWEEADRRFKYLGRHFFQIR